VTLSIEGLNPEVFSDFLSVADPSKFPSLKKYAIFCGYNQRSQQKKLFNYKVKPLMDYLAQGVIKAKDPKFYPLYLKMIENAKLRKPNLSEIEYHHIALNRVATFLLKEIYSAYRSSED